MYEAHDPECKEGLRVYMHIGSESVVEARELAAHAAATPGISGLVCMAPVYFKPTKESLIDFLALVAAAAPKLPFWYYHYPDKTGVTLDMAAFVAKVHEKQVETKADAEERKKG